MCLLNGQVIPPAMEILYFNIDKVVQSKRVGFVNISNCSFIIFQTYWYTENRTEGLF